MQALELSVTFCSAINSNQMISFFCPHSSSMRTLIWRTKCFSILSIRWNIFFTLISKTIVIKEFLFFQLKWLFFYWRNAFWKIEGLRIVFLWFDRKISLSQWNIQICVERYCFRYGLFIKIGHGFKMCTICVLIYQFLIHFKERQINGNFFGFASKFDHV